ncbi:Alpha-(1,6)-fucosyltransferase [Porphyridium purpureum]|uniref:Alpha-(1,6)-fucosyltransferase n=1 Tax=Porphyridium purpureum TaxID=35688 RepID=A0A5J4YU31_PORPP|nr:Alpha-(1,6)-fucosyltransferase [Porphyridium purpureum]|eukprot:POR1034..scf227_4
MSSSPDDFKGPFPSVNVQSSGRAPPQQRDVAMPRHRERYAAKRRVRLRLIGFSSLLITLVLGGLSLYRSRARPAHSLTTALVGVEYEDLWHEAALFGHRIAPFLLRQSPGSSTGTCVGRVLLFRDTKKNGFGAQMLRMVEAAALADQLGAKFVPDLPRHRWNYGGGWSAYFAMSEDARSCRELCRAAIPTSTFDLDLYAEWKQGNATTQAAELATHKRCLTAADKTSESLAYRALRQAVPGDADLRLYQRLLRRFWVFSDVLQRNVEMQLDALLVQADGSRLQGYMGVHIRRGDKYKDAPYVPIAQYVNAIMWAANRYDLRMVYVCSDDFAVINELKDMVRARTAATSLRLAIVDTSQSSREGHEQRLSNNARSQNELVGVEMTAQLLLELSLLQRASFFVGTFSSNVGRLVVALRDARAPQTSISLDTAWSPGVAFRSFNTTYCADSFEVLVNRAWCDFLQSAAASHAPLRSSGWLQPARKSGSRRVDQISS